MGVYARQQLIRRRILGFAFVTDKWHGGTYYHFSWINITAEAWSYRIPKLTLSKSTIWHYSYFPRWRQSYCDCPVGECRPRRQEGWEGCRYSSTFIDDCTRRKEHWRLTLPTPNGWENFLLRCLMLVTRTWFLILRFSWGGKLTRKKLENHSMALLTCPWLLGHFGTCKLPWLA